MKEHANSGFTLLEAVMVMAITLIMAGIAIPIFKQAMYNYNLNATVSAASGAISSARFQAIMSGYPFELTFTPATLNSQVYCEPTGASSFTVNCLLKGSNMVAVPAVPLPNAGQVGMKILTGCTNLMSDPTNTSGCVVNTSTTVTYEFFSNGTVTSTPNSLPALAYLQFKNTVNCTIITVTGVGNVQTAAEVDKNCL